MQTLSADFHEAHRRWMAAQNEIGPHRHYYMRLRDRLFVALTRASAA